ncbi:hypothetical protein VFPBJ_11690 [Purpureocillium lilacinum]|uniref:Uncharacterized protein n=1 Tax=Purpureocillium lilacinum TaxID=33203 RepID=A0A179EZ10_PURLI|nr:hypothetical protein VFPBJ_11690 [Purpureocillium lilacinum]
MHNHQATKGDTNNNLSLDDEDDLNAFINVVCAFIIPAADLTMPVPHCTSDIILDCAVINLVGKAEKALSSLQLQEIDGLDWPYRVHQDAQPPLWTSNMAFTAQRSTFVGT